MTLSPKLCAAAFLATVLYLPVANAAETAVTQTRMVHTTQSNLYAPATSPLSGVYLGGQVGYNHPVGDGDTLDNAASFTGVLGYRLNSNLRTDLEIGYRKNDYSETDPTVPITASGDLQGWSGLLSAWYDFANDTALTPYIGGGIGMMHESADIGFNASPTTIDDGDTAFVYQLGAGAAYDLGNNLAITADYRYLDTNDFTFDVTSGLVSSYNAGDYRAHELRIGMRYSF